MPRAAISRARRPSDVLAKCQTSHRGFAVGTSGDENGHDRYHVPDQDEDADARAPSETAVRRATRAAGDPRATRGPAGRTVCSTPGPGAPHTRASESRGAWRRASGGEARRGCCVPWLPARERGASRSAATRAEACERVSCREPQAYPAQGPSTTFSENGRLPRILPACLRRGQRCLSSAVCGRILQCKLAPMSSNDMPGQPARTCALRHQPPAWADANRIAAKRIA